MARRGDSILGVLAVGFRGGWLTNWLRPPPELCHETAVRCRGPYGVTRTPTTVGRAAVPPRN